MNLTCSDRDRVFLDGTAEEWTALEQHAANCPDCAEEIRAWKALSSAAEELRDYREDLPLWARIETSLRENERQPAPKQGFWEKLDFLRGLTLGWQTALAGALVVALTVFGVYMFRLRGTSSDIGQTSLLKNSALAEVERTERDYMKAIDRMATEAKPELDSANTPLMASYKEKLIVLDSAIDELRLEAGRNPSNAHLRYELLAMYQEKQETLQEVLETKR
jgi:hypothetical protein